MTKNVTLMGASYPDVPSILLPQTGGGSAEFFADKAGWEGKNCEFVETLATLNYTLADTSWSSWTPSTTATTIKASQDILMKVLDMENFDYILKWFCKVKMQYAEGTPNMTKVNSWHGILSYCLYKRPVTYANMIAKIYNYNSSGTWNIFQINDAYNSAGNRIAQGTGYGIACGATTPTYSHTSSNTPTLTVKSQTITARCNDSLFPTSRYSDVTGATIEMVAKLYKCPVGDSAYRELAKETCDWYLSDNP